MRLLVDGIIQPYLTEKTAELQKKFNEFSLIVDLSMSKEGISSALKSAFGVQVLSVRTAIFRKKFRKTRFGTVAPKSYKKAIVRLPKGQKLELK